MTRIFEEPNKKPKKNFKPIKSNNTTVNHSTSLT